MLDTAGDIIRDALMEITVLGAEAPVEPSDAQTAIRYLNRMMAAFDAGGIDIGWTDVQNNGSPITARLGAIEGIVFNLALRLWTQYAGGKPPPVELHQKAREGKAIMAKLAVRVGPSAFPSTLPMGSGNGAYGSCSKFYPDVQDDILAETTGTIGLEVDTADETV